MLIPWGTDAPIYHYPFATIGIVVTNVFVFIFQVAFPDLTDVLAMEYGRLNPIQWLTAIYAHGGVCHLLGNMLFLGIFGLVVEGKIGWWRFLIMYNLIGIIASFLIALIMLPHSSGGALGASCAIFGTMAVAMIWAPENKIFIKWILLVFYRPCIFDFEVSVLLLSFYYIATNFFFATMHGFEMSSETAHLLGVLPGIVFGVGMIVYRQVDCEGYDLLAVMRGKRGVRTKTTQQENEEKIAVQTEQARIETEYQNGMNRCIEYMKAGHYEMARKRFDVIRKIKPGIKMPEKWLVEMIRDASAGGKDNENSVALMQDYLKNYSKFRVQMTLRISRHLIVGEERPRKALERLGLIRNEKMSSKQVAVFNALAKQAKKQIADGVIELDELPS